MTRKPFSSFGEVLVTSFMDQIHEAWRSVKPPTGRAEIAPHRCEECDDLFRWFSEVCSKSDRDLPKIGWLYPVSLLAGPALSYLAYLEAIDRVLGGSMYHNIEDAVLSRHNRKVLVCNLTQRQKWCLLKLFLWTYLEYHDSDSLQAALKLRDEMGYTSTWKIPLPRAQT
ncbi:MAG: hypothetical protein HZC36_14885 [Armatimonadetes bacterium]|nr:hypothetical protein [Armatimonadota bacterium]